MSADLILDSYEAFKHMYKDPWFDSDSDSLGPLSLNMFPLPLVCDVFRKESGPRLVSLMLYKPLGELEGLSR